MKKLLPLLLLILIGCSEPEPINMDEMLIEVLDVYYTKDTHKPYSGPTYQINTVRKIRHEGNMKNGRPDGLVSMWYETGEKAGEGAYKNNQRDGLVIEWHKNGQKKMEQMFKDGKLLSENFWNNKGESVQNYDETEK